MSTSSMRVNVGVAQRVGSSEAVDWPWKSLSRAAALAAVGLVVCTAFQAYVFIAFPPPSFEPTAAAARDWFTLLQGNPLIGLLSLDAVMLVDYPLSLLVFLGLYTALRQTNRSVATIAAGVGLLGVATYFAANPAFTMLALSHQYAAAASEVEQTMALAAGQATMAIFEGSAFNASYVMVAIGDLILSALMLRSGTFGRATAYVGIAFAAMNLVPASAGTLGLVLSLASLPLMVVWLVLVARRLWALG